MMKCYIITQEVYQMIAVFTLVSILLLGLQICSMDNGQALTPPMGWIDPSQCISNQTTLRETVNLLLTNKLSEAGFSYLMVGQCWQGYRDDSSSKIVPNKVTFPSGIYSLATYCHGRGLKLGLATSLGSTTCQQLPGSAGYEVKDANTFAQWTIDFIQIDDQCNVPQSEQKIRFGRMSLAFNKNNRPMTISFANSYKTDISQWAPTIANFWSTATKSIDSWASLSSVLDHQVGLQVRASRGSWNNPGPLIMGRKEFTMSEQLLQYVLWCTLKAPLFLSVPVSALNSQHLDILTNQELIAISQDQLGIQGRRLRKQVTTSGIQEVWGGSLANNGFVLVFVNRSPKPASISVTLSSDAGFNSQSYLIRDPVKRMSLGASNRDQITIDNVGSHSVEVRTLRFFTTDE